LLGRSIALVILLFPVLARGAADLRTSLSMGAEYDNNVFNNSNNPVDDVIFRIGPRIRFRDERENLDYNFSYRVPYSRGIETRQNAGFDQYFTGGFSYSLGPRTRLVVNDRLAWVQANREIQSVDDPDVPQVNTNDERILRNNFTAGLDHTFGTRLSGSMNFASSMFQSDARDRRDVQTYAGGFNLNYGVNSKHRIGGGAHVTYQDFGSLPERPGSQTTIYRISASWLYRIDDTLTFSIRGGPTWIDTVQDGAAPIVLNTNGADTNPGGLGGNPFLFDVVAADGIANNVPVDTNGDGNSDVREDGILIPAGSLVVSPFEACGQLVDTGTDVIAPLPACDPGRFTVIPAGTAAAPNPTNDAIIDNILGTDFNDPLGFEAFTFVDTDGNGFPNTPTSQDTSTFTYFGTASLEKRWTRAITTGLSYRRSESGASGVGGSTILDNISARLNWRLSQVWQVSLRADWTQRESVAPTTQTWRVATDTPTTTDFTAGGTRATVGSGTVPDLATMFSIPTAAPGVDTGQRVFRVLTQEINTRRWQIAAVATRKLSRRLDARFRLAYNQQTSDSGTRGSSSDFDNVTAILGITYVWDPVRLW
jgi:hypothetical protein